MSLFFGEIIALEETWYALGASGKNPDKPFLLWLRDQACCACRRYRIDGQMDVVPHHIRRIHYAHNPRNKRSGKCGTGLKPEFCSVPLCVTCHDKVEGSHSDLAIATEDLWETWRWFYPALWAGETLIKKLGGKSLSDIDRDQLDLWLAHHGIGIDYDQAG